MITPPPSRLGPYVPIERVGVGALSQLFTATEADATTPVRATLRVLDASSVTARTAESFLDAATRASLVQHPRVLTVLDVGAEGEWVWFAAEERDGVPLDRVLEAYANRRLSPSLDFSCAVVAEVAAILAALDARDDNTPATPRPFHGSLWPASVRFSPDGDIELAGLGDTERYITPGADGHALDEARAFEPPEAHGGAPPSACSESWALGVLLHRLLSTGGATPDVLARRNNGSPEMAPLSPSTPSILQEIVRRATHTSPALRYQSPGQLCRELVRAAETLGLERGKRALDSGLAAVGLATPDSAAPFDVEATGVHVKPRRASTPPIISDARGEPSTGVYIAAPTATAPMATHAAMTPTAAPDEPVKSATAETRARTVAPVLAIAFAALSLALLVALLLDVDKSAPVPAPQPAPVDGVSSPGKPTAAEDTVAATVGTSAPASAKPAPEHEGSIHENAASTPAKPTPNSAHDNDAPHPRAEVDEPAVAAAAAADTAAGPGIRQAPEREASDRTAAPASPTPREELDSPAAPPPAPDPNPRPTARPSLRSGQSSPPPRAAPTETPAGPPGTLNVRSVQPAVVTINGERQGQTPLEGLQLAPGSYRIELSNPGAGIDRSYRIQIESGRTRTIINSGP